MANNPYVNKVQFGNTTLIDLTSDTVTADKLLQGYTAHDRTGALITGTAFGGGNDFIVTINWDETQEMYVPDRTFAEIQSAYAAGKNIVCAAAPTSPDTVSGSWMDENEVLEYAVTHIDPSIGAYFRDSYNYYESGIDGPMSSPPFYLTLPATAQPADVASGKVFFNADGKQTGTGSSLVTVSPLSVNSNGTYTAPAGTAYSPVTVNVSGGGDGGTASPKDVNFIDYDGTIVHSYTAEEFAALTAMPANPSHTGLTAQGWNWSLSDAKAQLAAMPDAGLTIGQMYITDDGKTRIYCHFEQGRLAPYLGLGVNGTVVVDWGDGSNTDTLTGTSLTTAKTVQHIYATEGDYTITLTVSSGSFAFFGTSTVAHILKKSTATTGNISRVYANCIKRVELGASVSVGTYAFYYCVSLSSITIPNSVTSIGTYAFYYCVSLTSITIPDGVTSISNNMFSNCNSLPSITIPNSVTSIGTNAFNNCYSLSSITIPDSVTSIGTSVFNGCYSLPSITIPDSVTSIGSNAFYYCVSLTSITIPDGVTSIGNNMFSNCNSLSSITIPDGVTSIGSNTFNGCYSLPSITIPNSVTSISSNAFNGCYSLSSITIPDGVTSIGNNAFQYCYSLPSITIPNSVTSISNNAFSSCYGLAEFHFLPATPPTVANSSAFNNVQTDCIIYVPTGSLAAYTSATNYPSSSTYTYVEE